MKLFLVVISVLLQLAEAQSSSITGFCDNVKDDIKYGPTAVLANLTSPTMYDSQKRPNSAYIPGKETTNEADDVYVALYINSVIELNEIQQSLTTSMTEEVLWVDERLTWDINTEAQCVPIVGFDDLENALPLEPKQFEGVDKLIWTPSTDIVNIVSREYEGKFVIIHPDATIHRFEKQEITTTCPMKFGQYPFDKHICSFDVSTFQHSDKDVSLHPGVGYPIINNETSLLDVSLLTTERIGQFVVLKRTTTTSYQGKYYTLQGQLEFERNGDVFAVDIMLPDILLHISIYSSFWLPADSPPARVSLCIISALSFRIMRNSISNKLPRVSYAIWVIDYMAVSQAIAVLSLIQYAIVCYYFSFEHVHDQLFKQFKKSKIPSLVKRDPAKAMVLFKEAKLQYEEFVKEANDAFEKKTSSSSKLMHKLAAAAGSGGGGILDAVGSTPKSSRRQRKKGRMSHFLFNSSGDQRGPTSTIDSDDLEAEGTIDSAMSSFEVHDVSSLEMTKVIKGGRASSSSTPRVASRTSSSISKSTENSLVKNNQNGTKPNRDSAEYDRLNFKLTISEVMVIAHVRAAFKQFDEDHNGVLRISELQKCLRHFARYYTANQVCSLVAAYRQSQGTSFSQHPTVHLADFFCILVELEDHQPLEEFIVSDLYALSPAQILDWIGRIGYPMVVIVKIMVFFTILQYYT